MTKETHLHPPGGGLKEPIRPRSPILLENQQQDNQEKEKNG